MTGKIEITMEAMKEYMNDNPGITWQQAIEELTFAQEVSVEHQEFTDSMRRAMLY